MRVEKIRERHAHAVLRLWAAGESYVLKLWPDAAAAAEIRAYRLLADLGVPTIRVIATTETAILLEDLETSAQWRLAADDDLAEPEVILALAEWYQLLHESGSSLGQWATEIPGEYDHISVDALRRTGRRLDLDHQAAWIKATEVIEALLSAWRTLPCTLIYNDFHVSNLAVGRTGARAVMIDFDRLRIGTRASDLRNVTDEGARGLAPFDRLRTTLLPTQCTGELWSQTFLSAYGPISERERIIDAPLAVIGALSQLDPNLPRIPRWARALCDEVRNGTLDAKLAAALDLSG